MPATSFSERPDAHRRSRPGQPRWDELMSLLSVEIAVPLTAAIERVYRLSASGKIDRKNLRALREEIERAREAGMIGQQFARFAAGAIHQAPDRIQLTQVIENALAQRAAQARSRGIQLHHSIRSAEVVADASLLSGLLNALLDWAMSSAKSDIEFRLDATLVPARTRLYCAFAYRLPADPPHTALELSADADGELESLPWHLMHQIASAMGLEIERGNDGSRVSLTITFPRTVAGEGEGIVAARGHGAGPGLPANTKLAGSHLLVLSPRHDLRAQVSAAVHRMGLLIDFAGSVTEAAAFCAEGLPHAIVYERALRDESFDTLRNQIDAQAPGFGWVEIADDHDPRSSSGNMRESSRARVDRSAIAASLPLALMRELSKIA